MIDDTLFALTLVSALGCGLIASSFFAFSSFVMKALSRLPPAQGIVAMQWINIVVINPWFMTALFGTALACVALAVQSLVEWDEPESIYRLTGSAPYLVGTILVTIAFNVPRNDALAAAASDGDDSADLWRRYVRPETMCEPPRRWRRPRFHRGALANSPGDPRLTIPHRVIATNTPGRSTSRSSGRRARGSRRT
jgi:uncharacterized membrane protein